MAELMKLLEQNTAFKSDLMLSFLSSAQYKGEAQLTGGSLLMTDHVQQCSFLHSDVNLNARSLTKSSEANVRYSSTTQTLTPFTSYTDMSTANNTNTYDNQNLSFQDVNLNGNAVNVSSVQFENSSFPCSRIMPIDNRISNIPSNLNELNKTNLNSTCSTANDNINTFVTNVNVEATPTVMENMNVKANSILSRQGKVETQKVEPNGARHIVPDDNANNTVDIGSILAEVHEKPSDSRQLLIDQVTAAIIDTHMNTTINTSSNVAAANERIHREKSEMPDMSSLSLNGSTLWQHFMGAMVPEITKVINFCAKLPGFPELEQEDKICLIKKGCFEVMVARFCMLVDHVNEEMIDPTLKVKATRCLVKEMPMGPFLDQFFTVASQFNPLDLTDEEIGLFTAILMICPEREGLKNQAAVGVLQQLFLQALYILLKQSHQDANKTLTSLMNLVPVFHKVNEDHLKFLRMIKMKSPAEFDKKFPPLHKELFDTC